MVVRAFGFGSYVCVRRPETRHRNPPSYHPLLLVRRTLHLGVEWRVWTRVERLSTLQVSGKVPPRTHVSARSGGWT